MSKAGSAFVVFLFLLGIYLVYTGTTNPVDVIAGGVAAAVIAALSADLVVRKPSKVFEPRRWVAFIVYAVKYLTVIEARAHLDVIRRILSPSLPVDPAIVRIPYAVSDDYAITTIANSITNTPGTVVVDIDTGRKYMYVHWIDAKATEDEGARAHVSEEFENYAKLIFEG